MIKNLFFIALASMLFYSCSLCAIAEDNCIGDAVVRFEYLSRDDHSNLLLTNKLAFSDIRWTHLLNDPKGKLPDTLFVNNSGITVHLWVTTNSNLKGIVTQVPPDEPDTVMIVTRNNKSSKCCEEALIFEDVGLNGKKIPFFETVADIQILK